MNSVKCEKQLKSLIEHFKNGGLDFNAADIEAIEHLLLENEMYHNTIKKKNKVIDKAVEYVNKHIKDDYYCRKNDYLINNLLQILKNKEVD